MQPVNSLGSVNNSIDTTETEGLIYMREEEKLAHDVYVTLYQQWGLPVFNNIANSEDRHENKLDTLLDKYQIEDPVGDNPIGVFVNPDLQQLYDNLVAQGSQSLTEALKVGVTIEETDIVDLQERIAQTDNPDIQQVYQQLLSGSNNHLSAFNSNLTGETGNTNSSNYLSNQIQGKTTDDTLTGGRSNQTLGGNCQGDSLTGKRGSDYGFRGGVNSGDTADFLLGSPRQINRCGIQEFQQIYPDFANSLDVPNQHIYSSNVATRGNLSRNNFALDFSGNQDSLGTLNIMPTNAQSAKGVTDQVT